MARFSDHLIIRLLPKGLDGPKRPGTKAERKFKAVTIHEDKTVGALKEYWRAHQLPDSAGAELGWCVDHGFIQLIDPAEAGTQGRRVIEGNSDAYLGKYTVKAPDNSGYVAIIESESPEERGKYFIFSSYGDPYLEAEKHLRKIGLKGNPRLHRVEFVLDPATAESLICERVAYQAKAQSDWRTTIRLPKWIAIMRDVARSVGRTGYQGDRR